jgi:hypothetical protein
VLRAVADGNAEVIEFQKSDKSSADRALFTVNLGFVCGELLDPERADIRNSSVVDAHLRTRLGLLLDPPNDTWWELTSSTDSASLGSELSRLLIVRALPYLEMYGNKRALVALWESGKSPGLTAVQRSRYLSELKGSGGGGH